MSAKLPVTFGATVKTALLVLADPCEALVVTLLFPLVDAEFEAFVVVVPHPATPNATTTAEPTMPKIRLFDTISPPLMLQPS
ncbi:hypothetical protein GCM10025858_05060 [Alicyclobacillus sacchari]|nr:hypothetical protein GCM10025858_05060 [Alicyclobacillus sacchari]